MLIRARRPVPHSPVIDLTPIIDMVFLLLIFFLVATTFHQAEREIEVALPAARAAGPISGALRELVINVTQDGRTIVGGEAMTEAALEQLVRQRVAANPAQKVSVRGDRRTPYANVVNVLDICKRAGISQPYLDTVLRE